MSSGPSIHDMIESAMADVEGRMTDDDQVFEKAASAEETVQAQASQVEIEEIFKYADALEAIGENLLEQTFPCMLADGSEGTSQGFDRPSHTKH